MRITYAPKCSSYAAPARRPPRRLILISQTAIRSLREVSVAPKSLARLEPVIGAEEVTRADIALRRAAAGLDGRTVWHISDNPHRGGVAEMLNTSLPYQLAAGASSRWVTVEASPSVRAFTKSMYYCLCGVAPLSLLQALAAGRAEYESNCREAAVELMERVNRSDLIILHDHQTAGLAPYLRAAGYATVWRAHLGVNTGYEVARHAWQFLERYVSAACAYIVSTPDTLSGDVLPGIPRYVIRPSIDPLNAKNISFAPHVEPSHILARAGIVMPLLKTTAEADVYGELLVRQPVKIVREEGPMPPDARLVSQIARWDRAKDIPGLMRAFVEHVDRSHDAYLALIGPDTSKDRHGNEVFAECLRIWTSLARSQRMRVHLIQLPVSDRTENSFLINSLQRFSTVIAQKSFAEGFGLTVTEGAWKGRPVVASAVGGIPEQVQHKTTGLLVTPPNDIVDFGAALNHCLANEDHAIDMGERGRERVRRIFLVNSHVRRVAEFLVNVNASL